MLQPQMLMRQENNSPYYSHNTGEKPMVYRQWTIEEKNSPIWESSHAFSTLWELYQTKSCLPVELYNKSLLVPSELHLLVKAVEDSKYMLEFEDNWDEEGATASQPETWERVIELLIHWYQKAYELFNVVLAPPKIYAGVEASIDVLWEEKTYKILANFPENATELASFYGETIPARETFEGTFNQVPICCNLLSILVGMKQCFQ